MGRIIYLISILDKIGKFFTIFAVFFTVILPIGIAAYSVEEISKIHLKIIGILLGISLVGMVLIPNKEEMYMIALTKDYEVEDVYSMTKEEIKGNIDYVFKKIEELKNDKE